MLAAAQSFLGLLVLIGLAWVLSEDRRNVPWRTVGTALAVQILLALLLFKLPGSRQIFLLLNQAVFALEEATKAGTSMVFGYLGGAEPPFEVSEGGSTYILAFRGLPLILVVSALSSLLFYWGILPAIVRVFAKLLQRSLKVGGAEGVGIAGNIFLGMVEAPLFIKHYLPGLQRGELFTLMVSGMATIAGTVMVLYASIIGPILPNAMGHLLVASILSAPASVALARVMLPTASGQPGEVALQPAVPAGSSMEAVTNGAMEGVKLLLNVVAMLIVLVALVALMNQVLGWLPEVAGQPLTLQRLLGWLLAPLVWLIGIPWEESAPAGSLLGTKTVLNEFLAYMELKDISSELSERSRLIMTYALCGFANPGSLGIMIGGLGGLVPDRRAEVVSLGLKSIVAGTMATCMTGAVVGCIVSL